MRSALAVPFGYRLTIRHFSSSPAPELLIECNHCAWDQKITIKGPWVFPRNPAAARIPDRSQIELITDVTILINAWFMHAVESPACYREDDRSAALPRDVTEQEDNVYFLGRWE